jgi:hypothetical protein
MAFYVEIVLNFMPKRQIEYVIIQNPSIFAVVFTAMILLMSILRANMLITGEIDIGKLVLVILISVPNALVEGYGIFQAIKKNLSKKLTIRSLWLVYLIFFLAAIVEVGFVQLLPLISAK